MSAPRRRSSTQHSEFPLRSAVRSTAVGNCTTAKSNKGTPTQNQLDSGGDLGVPDRVVEIVHPQFGCSPQRAAEGVTEVTKDCLRFRLHPHSFGCPKSWVVPCHSHHRQWRRHAESRGAAVFRERIVLLAKVSIVSIAV